jgi:hypothetical protein
MGGIDYMQWIVRTQQYEDDYGQPDRLLNFRVPELCPDCHGDPSWLRDGAHGNLEPCDHPNAPTIGRMLRIAEVVLAAEPREGRTPHVVVGDTAYLGPIVLLKRMREVQ